MPVGKIVQSSGFPRSRRSDDQDQPIIFSLGPRKDFLNAKTERCRHCRPYLRPRGSSTLPCGIAVRALHHCLHGSRDVDILPFPSVTGVHAQDPADFLLRLASHSLAASSINSDAVVSSSIAAVLMALITSGSIVTRN